MFMQLGQTEKERPDKNKSHIQTVTNLQHLFPKSFQASKMEIWF